MQIYLIRNKVTGKGYVGQTIWVFNERYAGGHWVKMTHNKPLKAAGLKYGKDAFEVTILWEGECSRDELDQLEDRYMREHNCLYPNGYNLKEAGKGGSHRYCFREYELIDASGTQYHVANLRQFCKRHGLRYNAMLMMVAGCNTSSQGFALATTPLEQIVDPNEEWQIEHIVTGEHRTVQRKNVPTVAASIGTSPDMLWRILSAKCELTKGWKLVGTKLTNRRAQEETRRHNGVELVHESGEHAVVHSVYAFAKEKGLDRGQLSDVVQGKAIYVKGWKLPATNIGTAWRARCGMEADLVNWQTGESIHVKNIRDWCRCKGLNLNNLYTMLSGRIPQYMGWTVAGRDLTGYTPPRKIALIRLRHRDGREVEGVSARDVSRRHGICSAPMIGGIVSGSCRNLVKGWSVIHVSFLGGYYPDLQLEPYVENESVTSGQSCYPLS